MPFTVKVEMLAFGKAGEFREVDIPGQFIDTDEPVDAILESVFRYGQNEFQPKPFPSVSVGDVIHLFGDKYAVAPAGFLKLKPALYQAYRDNERIDKAHAIRSIFRSLASGNAALA